MSVTLQAFSVMIAGLEELGVPSGFRHVLFQLATQLCEQESYAASWREEALQINRSICLRLVALEKSEIPDLTATRADIADLHARLAVVERRTAFVHGRVDAMKVFDPPALPSPLPRWQACAIQRTMNGVIVHDPLVQGAAAGYVFGDLPTAADFVVAVLSQEKSA